MLKTSVIAGRKLLIIFVSMANKGKGNSTKNPVGKTRKTKSDNLRPEKEEKIDLKELARDERTWKIVGFIFLFFSFSCLSLLSPISLHGKMTKARSRRVFLYSIIIPTFITCLVYWEHSFHTFLSTKDLV
jgi:hypothetical protein